MFGLMRAKEIALAGVPNCGSRRQERVSRQCMCSHSGVSPGDRERKHPPSDEPPASSGSSWLGEQGGG